MEAKRVKRKKLNFLKLVFIILLLYALGFGTCKLLNIPVKNIYVINNNILSDQAIIDQAKLTKYPSFFMTTSGSIKKRLLKTPYIRKAEIKKKWFAKLYLYITENKPLYYDKSGNVIVLETGISVPNNKSINNIPQLINYVPDTISKSFINKMRAVDDIIRLKISEIEYKPIEVDKERFLLTMTDGNYVYLTISKFDKINDYNLILPTLENKKGILYLDSGNYFEIFK